MYRRAIEVHRSRAAEAASQRYQSKPSWAEQAAAELAEAELAGDEAYQGSWTFMGSGGQEMGPYIKSELLAMHERYSPSCTAEYSNCMFLRRRVHKQNMSCHQAMEPREVMALTSKSM